MSRCTVDVSLKSFAFMTRDLTISASQSHVKTKSTDDGLKVPCLPKLRYRLSLIQQVREACSGIAGSVSLTTKVLRLRQQTCYRRHKIACSVVTGVTQLNRKQSYRWENGDLVHSKQMSQQSEGCIGQQPPTRHKLAVWCKACKQQDIIFFSLLLQSKLREEVVNGIDVIMPGALLKMD